MSTSTQTIRASRPSPMVASGALWALYSLGTGQPGRHRNRLVAAVSGAASLHRPTRTVPVEVYDNLYKEFNPIHFDAAEWVQIAKDAGMRYLVFTSKHHDGFVNFDSALTDYKITGPTPRLAVTLSPNWQLHATRPICPLAVTTHRRIGVIPIIATKTIGATWTIFMPRWLNCVATMAKWPCSGLMVWKRISPDAERSSATATRKFLPAPKSGVRKNCFQQIRQLQPNILINNRCGMRADFDTPEQMVGAYQTERAWESCITMGDQWAWKPDDKIKSLRNVCTP